MRRTFFALVLTLGCLQANAFAQTRDGVTPWAIAPRAGSAADGWPRDPLPQFGVPPLGGRVGVPLPQIGLPLPPIDVRPPLDRPVPRRHRTGWFTPWPYMVVMVPPDTALSTPQPAVAPATPVPVAKGSLVLDVQPPATQVFVDGFYVGTADDFSGRRGGTFLEAGPHAIELFAPAAEPVRFDVRIVANEALVYRRDLKPGEQPAPSAPAAAKAPTTIYMIPGCYVGNVPPKDAGLPDTCDISRAQVFRF